MARSLQVTFFSSNNTSRTTTNLKLKLRK